MCSADSPPWHSAGCALARASHGHCPGGRCATAAAQWRWQRRPRPAACSLSAAVLERIVVTVVESTAPGAADRLPVLTQGAVILGAGEILAVLEQVEVHRQPLLVQAVGAAVGLLLSHVAVHSGITVRIPEGELIALLVGVLNQQADHPREPALLLSECHLRLPLACQASGPLSTALRLPAHRSVATMNTPSRITRGHANG